MIVTVTTDASFNRKRNIGTYAFYIRSNMGLIQMSGQLRNKCDRPEEAEIKCIMNALVMLSWHSEWMKYARKIIINTDCLNAIHILTNDTEKIRMYKLGKLRSRHKLYEKHTLPLFNGKNIEFRHVKAHEHTNTARNFVNDWADKAAKEQMALYIKKVENPKTTISC